MDMTLALSDFLHLHEMDDLLHHAAERRSVVHDHGATDAPEAEAFDDGAQLRWIADGAAGLRDAKARFHDSAPSAGCGAGSPERSATLAWSCSTPCMPRVGSAATDARVWWGSA